MIGSIATGRPLSCPLAIVSPKPVANCGIAPFDNLDTRLALIVNFVISHNINRG
jgi:hypothetical protein